VDGGDCRFGIESTVVGLVDGNPVLLRPGAVARQEIEHVLNRHLFNPRPSGPILSPGMKYRHYAPKAHVILIDRHEAMDEIRAGRSCYIPMDLKAQNLYSHLRKADRLGYSEIAIELTDRICSDEALMNRLKRASEGR
jgi:L-threonylcarbamoyladenylate synthase